MCIELFFKNAYQELKILTPYGRYINKNISLLLSNFEKQMTTCKLFSLL